MPQATWLACLIAISFAGIARAQNAPSTFPKLTITDRTAQPLLKASEPWEDFCITFCRVLREGPNWRMWYASYDHTYKTDDDYFLCYATSTDGMKWDRPKLGLVEYNGSKDNNIIAKGEFGNGVFVDPHAPPAERYKVVYTKPVGEEWWIFGGTSADGIHWKRIDAPLLKKNSDTDNVCFVDNGVYRLYVRMWTDGLYKGKRAVGYTESKTFGAFPDPQIILQPGESDAPDAHFYNSAATKLGDVLYLIVPSVFATSDGTVRPHAWLCRNGTDFFRISKQPLIDLGTGFDNTAIYVTPGIAGDAPGEYWFYYNGSDIKHDDNDPKKAHFAGGIGRFKLKVSVK